MKILDKIDEYLNEKKNKQKELEKSMKWLEKTYGKSKAKTLKNFKLKEGYLVVNNRQEYLAKFDFGGKKQKAWFKDKNKAIVFPDKGSAEKALDMTLGKKWGSVVNEVMGYKMKPKDKKLVIAFIDGQQDGEGNALYIDKVGNKTELKGGMSGTIATRDSKGYVSVIGQAYGNVSQTWINFIRKNTPKLMLK